MTRASISPEPSGAGLVRLLGAAARIATSQRVLSLAIGLISAGVVVTTLATAGRVVSAERAVLERIDDADVTVIQVVDDEGGAGLDAVTVRRLESMSTVAWVVGLGPVEDVRPSGLPGAEPVPARYVVGSSPALRLPPDSGFRPQAVVGDASRDRLGLVDSSGAVDLTSGVQLPVVGTFTASPPLSSLRELVLIVEPSWTGPLRRIHVQVRNPEDVLVTAEAVQAVLGDGDNAAARVEVAQDLALVRAAVQGELGGTGRATVLQTLAAGLLLATLTIFAGLQGRRRDFGRRRALGATRVQLTGVVVLHVLLAAVPGALLGAVGGSVAVVALSGSGPGWQYPVAVALLTVAAMVLAAALPAVTAAWRDPVAALRVP
ncbi:FtsX-like permease family protein [Quadrisphaera sp. GCM10027208]|uniref:FtsX-like permease family protein n=1 Tax=Quadrisphaera sp. GCM10027208 TaxID=3273423 RepID=UPI003610C7A3|nr:hypothetical protein HJG43_06650 [Kineosporiaceae bacterium SCSIO 59966]